MTRAEIEAQLRLDNPTTTDDRGARHGPGSVVYETAIAGWADAMQAQASITARTLARAALCDQWAALPAWIRGPFAPRYTETVRLLDVDDDDAVIALIQYAVSPPGYDVDQLAEFELVRADLLASIQALKLLNP